MTNLILQSDSYKMSHFKQYPKGTEYVVSYIEARGTNEDWEETVFLGISYFIQKYLLKPITMADVLEAETVCKLHGVPFNKEGWERIVTKHEGYLPLRIQALPEGTVAPISTPLVQVINTDPKCGWLTSFIETPLLRAIWYPTTVGTLSREIKKDLLQHLIETGSSTEGIDFMLNDFGARGVSSSESASIGGFGHLVSFKGTDNLESIMMTREFYKAEMPAFSVIASEHSTMTTWGRENEVLAFRNMLNLATEGSIISVVSDSWDIYSACSELWGTILHDEVVSLGEINARLVVRPDSGDATIVPIECVELLMDKFGYTTNEEGYRVLPKYIRVLQGDGINQNSINEILDNAADNEMAAENFVFGMGGGLLQEKDRDTLKFAMKACAIRINGEWSDVYKNPIHGGKSSKRGVQKVVNLLAQPQEAGFPVESDLRTVYYSLNGTVHYEVESLEDIRQRAII